MISIVIPVHNACKTLEKCVLSIVGQQYRDVEIILVENGSTDTSYELCISLEKKYANIFTFRSSTLGVSAARNLGLTMSKGEIVGFCDADDFYEENALDYVSKCFENDKKLDILVTGFYTRNLDGDSFTRNFLPMQELTAPQLMKYILNEPKVMGSVWNKFYSRSIIENHFFSEQLSFCEDTHFNMLLLSENMNCRCKIVSQLTYNYVQNTQSVTANIENCFDSGDNLKYINALHYILEDCVLDNSLVDEVRYAIVGISINILYHYRILGSKRKKLVMEIKNNFIPFVKIMRHYSLFFNLKRIAWLLLILVRK